MAVSFNIESEVAKVVDRWFAPWESGKGENATTKGSCKTVAVPHLEVRCGENLAAGGHKDIYECDVLVKGSSEGIARQCVLAVAKDSKRVPETRQEISILKRLGKHPRIIELLYFAETPPPTSSLVVLEKVEPIGYDLDCVINKYAFARAVVPVSLMRRLIIQLTSALDHMHACGVIHRDLKVSNVLLDSRGEAKLIDFGLAVEYPSTARIYWKAQWSYNAPEVHIPGWSQGVKVDSFGLGVILHQTYQSREWRIVDLHNAADGLPVIRIGTMHMSEIVRRAMASLLKASMSNRWGLPELRKNWLVVPEEDEAGSATTVGSDPGQQGVDATSPPLNATVGALPSSRMHTGRHLCVFAGQGPRPQAYCAQVGWRQLAAEEREQVEVGFSCAAAAEPGMMVWWSRSGRNSGEGRKLSKVKTVSWSLTISGFQRDVLNGVYVEKHADIHMIGGKPTYWSATCFIYFSPDFNCWRLTGRSDLHFVKKGRWVACAESPRGHDLLISKNGWGEYFNDKWSKPGAGVTEIVESVTLAIAEGEIVKPAADKLHVCRYQEQEYYRANCGNKGDGSGGGFIVVCEDGSTQHVPDGSRVKILEIPLCHDVSVQRIGDGSHSLPQVSRSHDALALVRVDVPSSIGTIVGRSQLWQGEIPRLCRDAFGGRTLGEHGLGTTYHLLVLLVARPRGSGGDDNTMQGRQDGGCDYDYEICPNKDTTVHFGDWIVFGRRPWERDIADSICKFLRVDLSTARDVANDTLVEVSLDFDCFTFPKHVPRGALIGGEPVNTTVRGGWVRGWFLDLRRRFGINLAGIVRRGGDKVDWFPGPNASVWPGDKGLVARIPRRDGSSSSCGWLQGGLGALLNPSLFHAAFANADDGRGVFAGSGGAGLDLSLELESGIWTEHQQAKADRAAARQIARRKTLARRALAAKKRSKTAMSTSSHCDWGGIRHIGGNKSATIGVRESGADLGLPPPQWLRRAASEEQGRVKAERAAARLTSHQKDAARRAHALEWRRVCMPLPASNRGMGGRCKGRSDLSDIVLL